MISIMIISFFGHSYFHGNEYIRDEILKILRNEIGENNAQFYLGGYGGFDNFAFQCCKEFKSKHKNCKLCFVSPYLDTSYLSKRKESLLLFDEVIYPDLEKYPKKFAIIERNKWIIKQSDLIIFFVEFNSGGAFKALEYAKRKNIKCFNLANLFK